MRKINRNRLTIGACVVLALLIPMQSIYAESADNAGLLYFQAFMLYEDPNDDMLKMLLDVALGQTAPNTEVKEFINSSRYAIDLAITAADLPHCNWGLDYSKGMALQLPHLNSCRRLSQFVFADARILAASGDYKTAFSRCVSGKKFARHVSDRPIITYMVAVAINAMADKCLQNILADMTAEPETLTWLKAQLAELENTRYSLKPCLDYEAQTTAGFMTKQQLEKAMLFENLGCNAELAEFATECFRKGDEQFFERNRAYYTNRMRALKSCLDLPYPQAYLKLKELTGKIQKEATNKPEATLTALFLPAFGPLYMLDLTDRNQSNSVRKALDAYIIKARTGRLPDTLPPSPPKDLFSGEDFEYEKKADGFVLRCRGKDLKEDKVHEYEFKIRK
jgi:hypothetical protein